MSTPQELDEFFWRQDDLNVPACDGVRIDEDELAAYRLAHDATVPQKGLEDDHDGIVTDIRGLEE